MKLKQIVAIISLALSFQVAAQTATPLSGAILVDQAAVKTAVVQVQSSLSKALQDALSLQANTSGVMNVVYQASLAISVAKLSADGATLAQATQKLNQDASPILAANNTVLQNANQRFLTESKAGNAVGIAAAKVAAESATKQASIDQAAIFGALTPTVTEKVQASISRVLRNALKLGSDIVAGRKAEVEADKLALSADFATLVADSAGMGVKPPTTQLAQAASSMSQANKDKLNAFAAQVSNISQADKDKLAALATQVTAAANNMSQANKDKLAAFAKGK